MIYVTGDTHGDLSRFKKGKLFWLSRKDTVIILGDFGFLWECTPQEMAQIRWLGSRRYKILFLDGCHENFEKLAHFPRRRFSAVRPGIWGATSIMCSGASS